MKSKQFMSDWQKDRDEIIELLDVDRFKTFYRLHQDDVGGRQIPESDKVIMAAMCKMALVIESISEGTKKRAAEWLEANNFTKGIWGVRQCASATAGVTTAKKDQTTAH